MKSHYFAGLGAGMLLEMAAAKLLPETLDPYMMALAVAAMSWVIIQSKVYTE